MKWSELKPLLEGLPPQALIDLLQGLYRLSPQNKAWLTARFSPLRAKAEYLEKCRQQIIRLVYDPRRNIPPMPRFRDAKKVIAEYKSATGDPAGVLDLMLTYVERGHAFTNDFGDIDAPFYDALINMLEHFENDLQRLPNWLALYETRFRARLLAMAKTADIGWGYGDFVQQVFAELEDAREDATQEK
jgi:hypothetical protein